MNTISRLTIFGAAFFALGLLVLGVRSDRSPYETEVEVVRDQPVPFSHEHHVARAGDRLPVLPHVGRDSSFAGMPPT